MRNNKDGFIGIGVIGLILLGLFAMRRGGGGLLASLGRLMFFGVTAIVVLILGIVALVLYFALRRPKGGADSAGDTAVSLGGQKPTVDPRDRDVLAKGSKNLSELRVMTARIKNDTVRDASSRVCVQADGILKVLKDKPDAIPRVRQFLNYYLPTLGEILTKFVDMEKSGMVGDDMVKKMLKYLDDIRSAMERQHRNLFESDILDLTVEMEAMTMAFKRDGLLTDQEMSARTTGESINLNL